MYLLRPDVTWSEKKYLVEVWRRFWLPLVSIKLDCPFAKPNYLISSVLNKSFWLLFVSCGNTWFCAATGRQVRESVVRPENGWVLLATWGLLRRCSSVEEAEIDAEGATLRGWWQKAQGVIKDIRATSVCSLISDLQLSEGKQIGWHIAWQSERLKGKRLLLNALIFLSVLEIELVLEAQIASASVCNSPYPGNRDGRCNTLMHI
jgi:hypothetical protein